MKALKHSLGLLYNGALRPKSHEVNVEEKINACFAIKK